MAEPQGPSKPPPPDPSTVEGYSNYIIVLHQVFEGVWEGGYYSEEGIVEVVSLEELKVRT